MMKNEIANKLCNKPLELSLEDCHKTKGKQNPLCRTYRTCRICEKSDEQIEYIRSSTSGCVFLNACPGSGKTEVVGLKAAFEISQWKNPVGGIAVLTFTNNAAKEIEERLKQFSGFNRVGFPHYVGTIDSWLHGYIAQPFSYLLTGFEGRDGDKSLRLVDKDSTAQFLNAYSTEWQYAQTGTVKANQFHYCPEREEFVFRSGNQGVDTARGGIELADWQWKDLKSAKRKFLKGGFANQEDVEWLCFEILERHDYLAKDFSKRFPCLLIDEAQDLSPIQLRVIDHFVRNGSSVHFIGDVNQAIYEFKDVLPDKVTSFASLKGFTELSLSQNFRSCKGISDLCFELVSTPVKPNAKHQTKITDPCVCVLYDPSRIGELQTWYCSYLTECGLKECNSAIVARGWATISKLRSETNKLKPNYQVNLAQSLLYWGAGDGVLLEEALLSFGKFLSHKIISGRVSAAFLFCPEEVKSKVTWRLFLSDCIQDLCALDGVLDFDKVWSKWMGTVKKSVAQVILQNALKYEIGVNVFNLEELKLVAPRGYAAQNVRDSVYIENVSNGSIKLTTIHSVKGATLDSVMLVSAPTKQGKTKDGHWEYWLSDVKSEAARMCYVASSRPTDLLVWAVAKPRKQSDRRHLEERMEQLGFSVCEL